SWILAGMDADATLVSIDHDEKLIDVARSHLGNDTRLHLELSDGGAWINANSSERFDFIFADTWHGKFLLLDEVLGMLNPGGLYIIDDMLPQPNWPEGHGEKVSALINNLETRADLLVTKMIWSSGVIISAKR
ncbi:MAG TPA: SAM-dependent methyltransferase, partial [Chryseosolibacter sp.]|nr:SAM-dependent methyltransferase [Chryseosolibacter sp.]